MPSSRVLVGHYRYREIQAFLERRQMSDRPWVAIDDEAQHLQTVEDCVAQDEPRESDPIGNRVRDFFRDRDFVRRLVGAGFKSRGGVGRRAVVLFTASPCRAKIFTGKRTGS